MNLHHAITNTRAVLAVAVFLTASALLHAAETNPLGVVLGNAEGSGPTEVIDLGQLIEGDTRSFHVTVRNVGAHDLAVGLYTWGSRVSAAWQGADEVLPWTRAIAAGAGAELEITFVARNPLEADTQSIYIVSDGKVLILLTFDHLIRTERRLEVAVSTRGYNSGFAAKWSNFYLVCAGPAPSGYTYESHTFETRQVPANNDARNCSAHVNCDPTWQITGDNDVCRHFAIQGTERNVSAGKTARSVEAAADLNVTYRLIEHEPVLVRPKR